MTMNRPSTIKELTEYLSKLPVSSLFMTVLKMNTLEGDRYKESMFLTMSHKEQMTLVAKEARKRKMTVDQLRQLAPQCERPQRACETEETIRNKLEHNVFRRMRTVAWCYDCGESAGPSYMVNSVVWKEAFPEYAYAKKETASIKGAHVCLCLSCLQRRLRRNITLEDLTDVPMNAKFFIGATMALDLAAKEVPEGSFRDGLMDLRDLVDLRVKE
jgi:hypothetical protein